MNILLKSQTLQFIYILPKNKADFTLNENFIINKPHINVELNYFIIIDHQCEVNVNVTLSADKNSLSSKAKLKIYALMTKDCNAQIHPNLVVESNNVEVDHAVTIGTINNEILNFMKSRGFNKSDTVELMKKTLLTKQSTMIV